MPKVFLEEDVLTAAHRRVAYVFDEFADVVVSVSSGKDSTALFGLVMEEAEKRSRRVRVFFLDQEAEYRASIDQIERMMTHPLADPLWFQVPIRMTNATSFKNEFLYAWGEGQEWMRPKHPLAIHSVNNNYPQRFYDFFAWMENQVPGAAFLVGIRAEEALNRFRAVVKNPGYRDVLWSTKTDRPDTFRFYPIFDWGMGDVWKYIADAGMPYNAIYDKMLLAGHNYYHTMRVSNLIHEKSYTCLASLQELEPDTYDRMVQRLGGVHVAALYSREKTIFSNKELPVAFASWREYRDYLLETTPLAPERRDRFVKRFAGQAETEDMFRQQVRQLLVNDWENSLGTKGGKEEKRRALLEKWRAIL